GGLVAQARSHVYAPSSRACACTCVRVRVHSHVGASPRAAPGGATLIRHRCRPPPARNPAAYTAAAAATTRATYRHTDTGTVSTSRATTTNPAPPRAPVTAGFSASAGISTVFTTVTSLRYVEVGAADVPHQLQRGRLDRKSTRLNSSHVKI